MPAGPGQFIRDLWRRALAIAAASKNKEAAYLLCQWAVSKAQGARLLGRRRRAVPHSIL